MSTNSNIEQAASNATLTTVTKKFIMAFSGLALVGFVIVHLLGNLTLYSKTGDAFNAYAFKLESMGPLLTVAEIFLLGLFLVHIFYAFVAKKSHWGARPRRYRMWRSKGGRGGQRIPSNVSSRNMIVSGALLLLFVAIHVWQFRFGPGVTAGYTTSVHGEEARDLYRLVFETFRSPAWVAFYVIMMLFLGLHLRHGFWSAFQSAGWTRKDTSPKIMVLGLILSVVLAAGFLFIPIYIYFLGASS